jgi:hypothetical protein
LFWRSFNLHEKSANFFKIITPSSPSNLLQKPNNLLEHSNNLPENPTNLVGVCDRNEKREKIVFFVT